MAQGPKARERARPCPREFFCPGRKKFEVEAAISLYIARQGPIYIIDILLLCNFFKKKRDPLPGHIYKISGHIYEIGGHIYDIGGHIYDFGLKGIPIFLIKKNPFFFD